MKSMRRIFLRRLATTAVTVAAAQLGAGGSVWAQGSYPDKPVRVILPFPPGGSLDLVMRLVADKLGPRLGKPVVVENRPGASGVVGTAAVARAESDGYTLLFTPMSPLTTAAVLMKSLPYDARKAFSPVSLVVAMPSVLVVNPKISARTVPDFISLAKASPNNLTYSSPGIGTTTHLASTLLSQVAEIKLTHVPYQGSGPALNSVLAGHVDMMFMDTVNALPRIRSKELIPIAVASPQRFHSLPDVPTFAEAGYPAVILDVWFAMFAPAGTPAAIRQKLRDEVAQVLAMPEVAARLRDLGVEIIGSQPDILGEHLKNEYVRWAEVIRTTGMVPQ